MLLDACTVPLASFHGADAAVFDIDAMVPIGDAAAPSADAADAALPPIDALGPNDFSFEFDGTTLPSAVGWMYGSDCPELGGIALTESQALTLGGGYLHIDTTGPSTTNVDAYYIRYGQIDPTHGWAIEARLRVAMLESAPPSTGQAFSMLVMYDGGFYTLQVADAVFTADNISSPVDTSQFHVYRMRKATGETNYTVEVDGTPVLIGPPPGTEPPSFNRIAFGDSTCQSRNGAVDLDYVRFTQF